MQAIKHCVKTSDFKACFSTELTLCNLSGITLALCVPYVTDMRLYGMVNETGKRACVVKQTSTLVWVIVTPGAITE